MSAVPVYTEIESVKKSAENDDTVYVKAEDGVTYTISAETHILPYLTRNIVTRRRSGIGKEMRDLGGRGRKGIETGAVSAIRADVHKAIKL